MSSSTPQVVNLNEKLSQFSEHWQPKIAGALNGQYVKLAKLKGEFTWHKHDQEDELFYVISGVLEIELRDQTLVLNPGEFVIIPRGVEHKPVAKEEVSVMLFEPQSTLNTGDTTNDFTQDQLSWI